MITASILCHYRGGQHVAKNMQVYNDQQTNQKPHPNEWILYIQLDSGVFVKITARNSSSTTSVEYTGKKHSRNPTITARDGSSTTSVGYTRKKHNTVGTLQSQPETAHQPRLWDIQINKHNTVRTLQSQPEMAHQPHLWDT